MFGPSRKELTRQLAAERRDHARQISELLDRIMHMADRPWTPAPATHVPPQDDDEPLYVSALDMPPEEFVRG